jgi:uncharacterized tellurite resistance protein B-like protein
MESRSLTAIARGLEGVDPVRARYLAAFAFILSRVANADLNISEEETRAMGRLVESFGGLEPAHAALVVQVAKGQERLLGATENFLATREFRDMATRAEKQALLDCLFAVSAADDTVSGIEEEEIRKIAREIGLTNEEYLAVRAGYSAKRAVFRGPLDD